MRVSPNQAMTPQERESVKNAFREIRYDINATDNILEDIARNLIFERYLAAHPEVDAASRYIENPDELRRVVEQFKRDFSRPIVPIVKHVVLYLPDYSENPTDEGLVRKVYDFPNGARVIDILQAIRRHVDETMEGHLVPAHNIVYELRDYKDGLEVYMD